MQPATSHRPRFRQDLIAELIDDTADTGARFIDVMDPESGKLFRFFEVEYSLACAMDGERDVPGIVQWAKEELGLSPSTSEVQSVIAALRDLGYLEPAAASAPVVAEPARAAAAVAPEAAKPARPAKPTPAEPARPAQPAKPVEPARPIEVVHATARADRDRAATIPDLELGHTSPQVASTDSSIGSVADIELGSGITTAPQARDAELPAVDDIALGQPGRADVGDLSQQVGISVADVKEAVRASQMMPIVNPEAASIELAESRPSERPKAHPTRPQPAPRVARTSDRQSPSQPEIRPSEPIAPIAPPPEAPELQPAAIAARERAATAVERFPERAAETFAERAPEPSPEPVAPARPSRPDMRRSSRQIPVIERPARVSDSPNRTGQRPPIEMPPEPRVSRTALALLALLLVLGVGFVTYKVVLKKPESQPSSESEPVAPAPVAVKPAEPPPVEVRQLATSAEKVESITSTAAGVIESIQAGPVKRGDIIVRFAGRKRLDAEIAAVQRDVEKRLQPELAAAQRDQQTAQTAGNAAKAAEAEKRVADWQKSINDKQAKLAAKRAELEKYVLRTSGDGKVIAKAAAGAKVNPADEIAQLVHAPLRIVTFKTAAGNPKTRVVLVSHASGRKLSCVVAKVDAAGTTIECPLDVAPEGAEVTFGGIDTSPPEAAEAQPEPPAAGSSAVDNAATPAGQPTNPNPSPPPAQRPQGNSTPASNPGGAAPAGSGEAADPAAPTGDKSATIPGDKPAASGDKPGTTPSADPSPAAAGSGSAQ